MTKLNRYNRFESPEKRSGPCSDQHMKACFGNNTYVSDGHQYHMRLGVPSLSRNLPFHDTSQKRSHEGQDLVTPAC